MYAARISAHVFCLMLAAAGAPQSGFAKRPLPSVAPLPVAVILNRETVRLVGLSANRRWLAVIVVKVGRSDRGNPGKIALNTLRVIDTTTGESRTLTPSGTDSNTFAWSRSGESLVFDVQDAATRRLWIAHGSDFAAMPLSAVNIGASELSWVHRDTAVIATQRVEAPAPPRSNDPNPNVLVNGARVTVYPLRSNASAATQDYASNDFFRGDLVSIDANNGSISVLARGTRPQSIRLSPDGRWIAYATLRVQASGNGYRNLFDFIVTRADGHGSSRVVAHDVESISSLVSLSWSPQSDRITFVVRRLQRDTPVEASDLYLVNIQSAIPHHVVFPAHNSSTRPDLFTTRPPLWTSDGSAVIVLGERGLWRADARTHTAKLIGHISGKSIRHLIAPRGANDLGTWASRGLLVIARDDETQKDGVYCFDLRDGRSRILFEAEENLSTAAMAKTDLSWDGKQVIFARESSDTSEQLWVSDRALKSLRVITHLNPELDSYRFGRTKLISWQDGAQRVLRGALLLPSDYKPGKRYPLIVEVYGGDKLSTGVHQFGGTHGAQIPFQHLQLLATRGFAVLSADSYLRPRTALSDIAAGVLPGVDKAIELGVADSEALGIMGRSNGGYSALSMIVQTQRFKAAVITSGFANLFSMYGQMHPDGTHWAMSWLEKSANMGGTPWQYAKEYLENSPYFHIDRVTTPVLLLHGAADTAVAAYISDETFMGLQRLGKPVEYAKYADEGHVFSNDANARDAGERALQWFESHLRKEASPIRSRLSHERQ